MEKREKKHLPGCNHLGPRDALDSGNLAKAGHTVAFPAGQRVEMAGGSKVSRFGWGGTFWDIRRWRRLFWEDGDDGDFFVSKLLKGAFCI